MSTHIFFHTDDDGRSSAAILDLYLAEEPVFHPINYNHEFPFEEIKKKDKVFIVDFSLQKDGDWEKLMKITKNIVWIDHHQSAIEKTEGTPVEELEGIREVGRSGCELTWEYCFKEDVLPEIIHRVGRFDVWDMEAYGEEETEAFMCGLMLYDTDPTSENWEKWIEQPELIDEIIDKGYIAKAYRDKFNSDYLESFGFEATLDGYSAYCCNTARTGSLVFNSINKKDYDILVIFVWDGEKWNFSVFSVKDKIDCSKICEKYGGGGHKGAAGFKIDSLEKLPFKKVEREDKFEALED
jgi:oligoribonuclease NrnB/cAMP/cGMP phosphodiesterase (DHH superfamily)